MRRNKNFFARMSILSAIGAILLALALECLYGLVFMLIWNNLLPLLWASAPSIGFWLATGIVFIVRVLITPIVGTSKD